MRPKIIIVGKGVGWEKAPKCVGGIWEEYAVWGVNDLCLRRDVDMAFNMHDLDKHKDHKLFNKTIAHVNKHQIPIVTQKQYPHIPSCIPFPIDVVFPRRYFTNSIDYMVAYAYIMNAREIEMYGVSMLVGTEYALQRPSLEYWIGKCEGKGIRVVIHGTTSVCRSPQGLYGYDWDEEDMPHVKNRRENQ